MPSKPLKVCVVEACSDTNAGSIGAFYVAERARAAGHHVDPLRRTTDGYDVELVSVHHCLDFPRLATMPKRATWRIVGGHPMQNNPRPVIPFADAVCVGEGESWIGGALNLLATERRIEALADLPGTIISGRWRKGDPVPAANVERPLPQNPPYLNRPGTRSAAWYIEIARGCPYRCHYCELGHSTPFRLYDVERVKRVLDMVDTSQARKVNFYAPDEASHPHYKELFAYLRGKGCVAGFSSMRVDSVLRRGLPDIPTNYLIRVGIDGLTEETRRRVGKDITDDMIVEYFRMLTERGFVQLKTFMMVGYPWETVEDFEGFERLMDRVLSLPLARNVSLRVKWTPFIPQPCTPLGDVQAVYDHNMMDKVRMWHALRQYPRKEPGFWVTNDGLMSWRSHQLQCKLTAGDEEVLLRYGGRLGQLHQLDTIFTPSANL
jgi:radical SAM superfamily enzyme YgiQ (UPF0313 family)